MACGRCGGLMVVETICAEAKESWGLDLPVTRCLNCGNIEDPMIRWHRVMRTACGQAVRQAEDIERTLDDCSLNESSTRGDHEWLRQANSRGR